MHPPTPEQQLIIETAKSTSSNLIINALAGAAKTTTLEMICNTITSIPILSLAFNKRIADEMKKRLPSHVEARTMNSLGHSVWSKVIGKRLIVNPGKSGDLLKEQIKALPQRQQSEAWEDFADTLRWCRLAKRDGFIPKTWSGLSRFNAGTLDEWLERYDETPSAQQRDMLVQLLHESIKAAYAGLIDYDDQIYMPVCFGAAWPQFPLVLVDEAQDLNELQHEMLSQLAKKRLIAVGDPWQSIYLFRGAKSNSMAALAERWNMQSLMLSVSFRVPQSGVIRARCRVPHMQWRENAPVGRIERLDAWNESNISDGSAIICRNNAPLFRAALRLLGRGRGIKLVGMDIGPGLVRLMKKLGPLDMTVAQAAVAVDAWRTAELPRAKNEDIIHDKAECLHVLCAAGATLRESITKAEDLFKRDGLVQLLSGHKAKGLEWETVFHLDPWRIPSRRVAEGTEEWEQEMNVRYVIETRFKENLLLVDSEGWQ